MGTFRLNENPPGWEKRCQKSGRSPFKTHGRYAFPMKASGGPNDPPNASEGGNLRPSRRKQYTIWRDVVLLLQLGIALSKLRLLLVGDGVFYPKSTSVKAKGEAFSENDACARGKYSPS